MSLSVEAIIAIIALFVALVPLTYKLVARNCRRRQSRYSTHRDSQDLVELGQLPLPAQRFPYNPPPWSTTSVHIHFEQGRLLGFNRGQQPRQLGASEDDMPRLGESRTIATLSG
ncbi:hypothetical protein F5Y08DRAFT_308958 [Xylaria arbuscula]|nr:hypothetical protein F5Y08DRAFT_308958 [Xylaria arbuscula]